MGKPMDTALPPPLFPIEARFTVTEEVVAASEATLKDAIMPPWVQIALPLSAVLQVIAQLPKLTANRGNPLIIIGVIAFVGGLYGFLFWLGRRKKKKARAAMLGGEIVVRFFDDGLEFGEPHTSQRIGYSFVRRAGRDERDLVVIIDRIGGLFIPTSGFASPEQIDAIFSHLREALKKK